MSHEKRTPLNAILRFSQTLAEEDLTYQANEEVKDIVMASETLLEIVNGILDISKIEANKLEIVNTEYNLNTMLEELVSLTKARIGEKPLELKYSFSPDLPKFLYGDKVRVKQVVLNLLTNAVKYTKTGWIEFKVNCVKMDDICRLLISVQDTGIGIKQESIGKLFNKFERLDIEKNNTIEGTGLGLAITKKLLELMGGKIVVQSIYGEGSKFTVAIDQRIITTPTNPVLERTQELSLKDLNLLNRRILVVDDNMINLKVATRLLQDYHCIIDTLSSGSECVNKIAIGASYDLILMDDMMPKMSGTETLHKLQEIEEFNTPVVALTANAISGMREKYLSEGFNDYLSKPIDKTELNKILNKFLG
jgi:CheY-like chemotaxis protein/two-component sensor histidine kinase